MEGVPAWMNTMLYGYSLSLQFYASWQLSETACARVCLLVSECPHALENEMKSYCQSTHGNLLLVYSTMDNDRQGRPASLVPRPPPFFVLRFSFSIYNSQKRKSAKNGKGLGTPIT